MKVGGATTLVALKFKAAPTDFYKVLSLALTSGKVTSVSLEGWAKAKALAKPDAWKDITLPANPGQGFKPKKILILWSRYSGQNGNGGYNPAGDSDITGQQQLIKMAEDKELGFTVITVGHGPTGAATPEGKIHLGEFWKEAGSPFEKEGRQGQASLYARLAALHYVIQVGQKTGGMDNAALVKVPTVYIEDKQSPTRARMTKWTSVMPTYQCAEVSAPPTAVGKAIRASKSTPTNELQDARKLVAEDAKKPEKDRKYVSGYSDADIKIIKERIIAVFKEAYPKAWSVFVIAPLFRSADAIYCVQMIRDWKYLEGDMHPVVLITSVQLRVWVSYTAFVLIRVLACQKFV